jgi:hypothetical protein
MTTDLGRQKQDKLLLIGKLVTGTIAVGKIGNEEPIVVVHDSWVSPDLKLVVKELNQDPRTGNRTMEMTHIRREEPDAARFRCLRNIRSRSGLMCCRFRLRG